MLDNNAISFRNTKNSTIIYYSIAVGLPTHPPPPQRKPKEEKVENNIFYKIRGEGGRGGKGGL
jgi:hypothetical protein